MLENFGQYHSVLEDAINTLKSYRTENSVRVVLSEIIITELFVLRALNQLAQVISLMEPILTFELSTTPNSVMIGKQIKGFWLREQQWLLVVFSNTRDSILQKAHNALSDCDSHVVDVSAGYCIIGISGSKVRDVINKGCPLDIHPRVFGINSVAQTHLAQADILLHCVKENHFEIYVRSSFAEYLWFWLYDAALEYGVKLS